MREIRFRAIHKLTKHWFEDIHIIYQDGEWFEDYRALEDGRLMNLEQVAIMQYTGLKDKNGMVIYEGDIVQTGWQGNEKGVVVFESSTYCVDSGNGYMYFNHPESYEVIGNVYENPELLGDSQ